METIGINLFWSFFDASREVKIAKNTEVRGGDGCPVDSYLDLAKKIAELQFRNKSHVLLFRGQNGDFRNRKKNTSIKPGLFRPQAGKGGNPSETVLLERFKTLKQAEEGLIQAYQNAAWGKDDKDRKNRIDRLKRTRILRWSILQHYEVCRTPLLDVTHSLRIAASFATLDNPSDRAYIYVLGVPNLSGEITASSEAGIQIVRLSSVCPPEAVRPHIQEGYLLGEYPELDTFEQKEIYQAYEIDFGLRLVAKFYFDPLTFWNHAAFPKITREALYPDESDPLYDMALLLKKSLPATA